MGGGTDQCDAPTIAQTSMVSPAKTVSVPPISSGVKWSRVYCIRAGLATP